MQATLDQQQFERIQQMVYQRCGIALQSGKEELVRTRLSKRLASVGMDSYEQYVKYVAGDSSGKELAAMIDALTTNKTGFFREMKHFEYLRKIATNLVQKGRRVQIWSAGCSSGEEPFSAAMLLLEQVPDLDPRDVQILATDISSRMLAKAREGVYRPQALSGVPPPLLRKCFTRIHSGPSRAYRINDNVRSIVKFARLNLIGAWPMKGPFSLILCRNVMIYLDKPAANRLAHRLWELLGPGGHLFTGHAERIRDLSEELPRVQPAIYVKAT